MKIKTLLIAGAFAASFMAPDYATAQAKPKKPKPDITGKKEDAKDDAKEGGKGKPKFDREKIKVAIMKAFLAVEGSSAAASSRIHEQVEQLTDDVVSVFERRMPSGGSLHIEDIQDQVELQLMRNEHQQVARSYVLYREERKNQRNEEQLKRETTSQKSEESSKIEEKKLIFSNHENW